MTAGSAASSKTRGSSNGSKTAGRARRPLVYLKIAWMDFYSGDLKEPIYGNHRYLHKKLKAGEWVGAERFNFADKGVYNYGYAPFNRMTVNFARLGGDPDAEYMDGVDVVFIARRPKIGGVVVIGWYRNARLYRDMQLRGSDRYYIVRAKVDDTHLVPAGERCFLIPISTKSGPRSPALWYGDEAIDDEARGLIAGDWKPRASPTRNGAPRRLDLDVEQKAAVEKAAITAARVLFEHRGYTVDSVESAKCGWDLEARISAHMLKIEVKGTAHSTFVPELTPNEYDKMQKHRAAYRIVLVTDALNNPQAYEFIYSELREEWIDEDGRVLRVEPRLAARLHF